jgi:protein subunit release factor A
MRRKQNLLKLALLQEKHKTIRELIQSETDHEKLRMYKAELESIASELRDLHQRIQDLFLNNDAA